MFAEEDIRLVRQLVHDRAGISIEPDKRYLIEERVARLAASQGVPVRQLLTALRHADHVTCTAVVELFCNHETYFFRDPWFYESLRNDVLPGLQQARAAERRLRIWCAACSTGQEVWSVAMLVAELPGFADWDVEIMGSDISPPSLQKAESGRYTLPEVNRGLPAARLARHFHRQELHWVVNPELRRRVRFQPLNLVAEWPDLPLFDIVLLRNVLIYFEPATQRLVLQRALRAMRRDGYLFLGGCESALGVVEGLRPGPGDRFDYYRMLAGGGALPD